MHVVEGTGFRRVGASWASSAQVYHQLLYLNELSQIILHFKINLYGTPIQASDARCRIYHIDLAYFAINMY